MIDYVFIDGHRDEKATISWSNGMRNAWEKIIQNKKIKLTVNLKTIGICVLDNDIKTKLDYSIPLI